MKNDTHGIWKQVGSLLTVHRQNFFVVVWLIQVMLLVIGIWIHAGLLNATESLTLTSFINDLIPMMINYFSNLMMLILPALILSFIPGHVLSSLALCFVGSIQTAGGFASFISAVMGVGLTVTGWLIVGINFMYLTLTIVLNLLLFKLAAAVSMGYAYNRSNGVRQNYLDDWLLAVRETIHGTWQLLEILLGGLLVTYLI